MKLRLLKRAPLVLCLLSSVALFGQASRVAIISVQEAVARTQQGQKLANDLQAKYKPMQDSLRQLQNEISTLRDQLSKGANTMSDEAQRDLIRQIQTKERQLQRDNEDAQADFNGEMQQLQQELLNRILAIIDKHAKENGYAVVLDISSPQSPVLYAINEVNITNTVIQLYDQEYPAQAAAAPAPAAASGAAAGTPPAQD